MAYHYSIPPPGYIPYEYSTSASTSPAPDDAYDYYIPQYRSPLASPHSRTVSASTKRQHVRTASYSAPRMAGWHSPAGYPSPSYHSTMPDYSSPPPPSKHDYVSTSGSHIKPRARRFSMSGGGGNAYAAPDGKASAKRHASMRSQTQPIYVDSSDEALDRDDYTYARPVYTYVEPRSVPRSAPLPRTRPGKISSQKADSHFFSSQAAYESVDTPVRSRARRASTTAATGTSPPARPKTSSGTAAATATASKPRAAGPPPEASASDAARHHIPAGYSLKNWDPTESPILLLGSVFDANSLGKWIYDWTVYHHKAGSPMTEVAGELWLLLIKFAGKMKRAEECLPRVRAKDRRDLLRDFHLSGERIWAKVKALLKACEEYMWRAAKKSGSSSSAGKVQMGEKSGIEFVRSIFGRERELERTERLMASVRLWNMRFDTNCEDILRRPSRE